ncbi:hypothetical protein ACCAA_350100 [Candidatus Accumulibacter aalborgensis]|uniref:Uncharacterized protein n=1 Tax=Candidatus Accumulibacter aalborgensis TaxID=1860102 RepID=A0A1A8XQJ3_9PROT|nr:hypothetical protein ACCAA_350100 [Candidatus Accumulibacter aalborgensis]
MPTVEARFRQSPTLNSRRQLRHNIAPTLLAGIHSASRCVLFSDLSTDAGVRCASALRAGMLSIVARDITQAPGFYFPASGFHFLIGLYSNYICVCRCSPGVRSWARSGKATRNRRSNRC